MEDDDLEYDISFPTPGGTVQRNGSDDDDADLLEDYVVTGETKEPVVILVGWAGCKDQYLSKYSKIHDQRRCITIRYIPPQQVVFFKPYMLTTLATKMLDLLCDYCLEENPIVFHIFSNNGCYFYSELSRILHSSEGKQYSKLQIKGVIVDCGPGRRRVTRAARAFANSSGAKGIMRYLYFLGMCLYLLFSKIYFKYFVYFSKHAAKITIKPNEIFETMKDDKALWPQLFITSKGDTLIPHSDIKDIVDYRKSVLRIDVDYECYDTGEHVSLLRAHPELYTLRCQNFVNNCLKSNEASAL